MKRILVVVDNAGSATYLAHLIRHNLVAYQWLILAKRRGAGRQIFIDAGLKKNLINRKDISPVRLFKAVRPDVLLCGSGWSGFELPYIKVAKNSGLANVAILDHWNSQRERFGYKQADWQDNLPNYLIVCDQPAYYLAKNLKFKNLIKLRNYYFADILAHPLKSAGGQDSAVLYISETLSFLHKSSYIKKSKIGGEHEALEKILKNFPLLSKYFQVDRLIIRLHPSEKNLTKYDSLINKYAQIKVIIENPRVISLLDSLRQARIVLGKNSMGLFVAFLSGKIAGAVLSSREKSELPLPNSCLVRQVKDLILLKNTNHRPYIKKMLLPEKYNLSSALKKIL